MAIKISSSTKILCIIGNPIEHSISPYIHNALINYHKLDYIYLPFLVKEQYLKKAIEGIRALNITGVNVTIPYKEKVMKYLDEIDSEANKIKAVNTILNKDNKLIGYNTDVDGFLMSLKEANVHITNKIAAVIGAGGVAKAILTGLLKEKIKKIFVLNRTYDKAKKLTKLFPDYKIDIEPLLLVQENIKFVLNKVDLLINTTSVGMSPNVDESVIDKFENFNKDLVVYDVIYTPIETKLLRLAKRKGLKTINGLNMLIYQAAKSFLIWTGKIPDIKLMKEVAQKVLR